MKLILYRAKLVLDSPLCIGVGHPNGFHGVNDLRIDGSGKPVIPGTALAGVFFEDLEQLQQRIEMPSSNKWLGLSGKLNCQDQVKNEDLGRSALRFSTGELQEKWKPEFVEIRDRIKKDPITNTVTTRDGNKFAQKQVIKGLSFTFNLEIEGEFLDHEQRYYLLNQIERVLLNWQQGFRLGNSSAAGNGWVHLEDLEFWPVCAKTMSHYMGCDSPFKNQDHFMAVPGLSENTETSLQLEIQLNSDSGAYGLDFLEIQQGDQFFAEFDHGAPFLTESYCARDGELIRQKLIPGSSIRGALRALLSRDFDEKKIEQWFGSAAHEGSGKKGDLLISDAYPKENVPKPEDLWIPGHAEDEWMASTHRSALFSRNPILDGHFVAKLRVNSKELIEILKEKMKGGQPLQLGRGGGHPKWTITEVSEPKIERSKEDNVHSLSLEQALEKLPGINGLPDLSETHTIIGETSWSIEHLADLKSGKAWSGVFCLSPDEFVKGFSAHQHLLKRLLLLSSEHQIKLFKIKKQWAFHKMSMTESSKEVDLIPGLKKRFPWFYENNEVQLMRIEKALVCNETWTLKLKQEVSS